MSSGSGLEPPARQTTADNESSRGRSVIRVRGRSSTRARGRGLQVQASTYESVSWMFFYYNFSNSVIMQSCSDI